MDKIIEILNNLDKHIIYNKYINSICYSAEFIKAKEEILKMLEEKEVIKIEERFREMDKRIDKLKREGYFEFEGMR